MKDYNKIKGLANYANYAKGKIDKVVDEIKVVVNIKNINGNLKLSNKETNEDYEKGYRDGNKYDLLFLVLGMIVIGVITGSVVQALIAGIIDITLEFVVGYLLRNIGNKITIFGDEYMIGYNNKSFLESLVFNFRNIFA